jgi:hypothetical protein
MPETKSVARANQSAKKQKAMNAHKRTRPADAQIPSRRPIHKDQQGYALSVTLTAEERKIRCSYLLRRKARNKRCVAWHEAAHCVVMSQYGLGYQAWVAPIDGSNKWTGEQCSIGRYQPNQFQSAVVAWAGSIVDYLSGWPLDDWRQVSRVPFESVAIQKVTRWEKYGPEHKRAGRVEYDLLNIVGNRQKWRALNLSWEIVVRRRMEIAGMAEILMKRECVEVFL